MIQVVARREVTLRTWAEERDLTYDSVRSWRQWRSDFPDKSQMAGRTALYYEADLNAFLRRNPNLGHGIGWNRKEVPAE